MQENAEEHRNEPIRYEDMKGLKVIDTDGMKFGSVQDLVIDPFNLEIKGIIIHQGFNKNVLIHREYVERIGVNCVMLKMPPIIKSMEVIDIDGVKIGKVQEVFMGTGNMIELIEVKPGLRGKILRVPQQEIHSVCELVILKHTKEEYVQGNY